MPEPKFISFIIRPPFFLRFHSEFLFITIFERVYELFLPTARLSNLIARSRLYGKR